LSLAPDRAALLRENAVIISDALVRGRSRAEASPRFSITVGHGRPMIVDHDITPVCVTGGFLVG
jgi:hypothetical protein